MFIPGRTDVLLTASVDGLVCAFDVKHSLDDEEGLLQVRYQASAYSVLRKYSASKFIYIVFTLASLCIL